MTKLSDLIDRLSKDAERLNREIAEDTENQVRLAAQIDKKRDDWNETVALIQQLTDLQPPYTYTAAPRPASDIDTLLPDI